MGLFEQRIKWRDKLEFAGAPKDEIDQFISWHEKNPDEWRMFEEMALTIANVRYARLYSIVFGLKHEEHKNLFKTGGSDE